MKYFVSFSFLVLLAFALPKNSYSQLSFSYYAPQSKVGASVDYKSVWAEFRLPGNMRWGDVRPEVVLCLNVITRERFKLYGGVGFEIEILPGLFRVPAGIQFLPIESNDRFLMQIEAMFKPDMARIMQFQTSIGVRYRFDIEDISKRSK